MKIHNYLKINDAYLRQAQAAQQKDKRDSASPSDTSRSSGLSAKDEIVLSPRATEIRILEDAAQTFPQVRQGKVEAIKKQIQANAYALDGKLVARSIIDLLS
jgi:flagellar biosynthesis anti-sigma factor FlgM